MGPSSGGSTERSDVAWTGGALLGVALGLAGLAYLFTPGLALIVVLGIGCVAAGCLPMLLRPRDGAIESSAPAPAAAPPRTEGLLNVRPVARAAAPAQPVPDPPAVPAPAVPAPAAPAPAAPAPAVPVATLPSAPGAEPELRIQDQRPAAPASPPTLTGPDHAYKLGRRLEAEGDAQGAERAYREAADQGSRMAAMSLGEALQHRGDLDEAQRAYTRAADGDDALAATASLSLGVVLEARGDLAGAELAYRRAAGGDTAAAESASMLLKWLERRLEGQSA